MKAASIRVGLCLALTLCLCSRPLAAQNLKPFVGLRLIKTAHFDIIFPEASRRTAQRLARFADQSFERVCGLLGIRPRERIPVLVTPHTDAFNGYMNPLPYIHIVLFDTPMDINDFTSFGDSLEGLFVHELTHAISLSSRSPFFEGLHRVFGGWVMPAGLNAPAIMVEGVTVSFESLEGQGRANDPLVKQRLRQAMREGKFLTPLQAGAYDKPLPRGAWYDYGGLFSAYIQKRFGMPRYAELWKRMGSTFRVSFDYYRAGFYGIFKSVYGLEFLSVWADFADELRIEGLEDNVEGRLSEVEGSIAALDAAAGRLHWLDRQSRALVISDPEGRESPRRIRLDRSAYDIDVSDDGERVLVSSYVYSGERATALVREFFLPSGRPTGRTWKGLYRARYFREGLLGLASDLHGNRIVYRARGQERTLLSGDDELVFAAPAPVGADGFAYIAALKGERSLYYYDFEKGQSSVFRSGLEDDADRWKYLRDLRSFNGAALAALPEAEDDAPGPDSATTLLCVYDHDDRFYKLALIELRSGGGDRAIFSTRDFSGGVFDPVLLGSSIYYRASFAESEALMRFPEKAQELSGLQAPLERKPSDHGASARDRISAAENQQGSEPGALSFKERPYIGLAYFNPFRCWLPDFRFHLDDAKFSFDGAGIFSYMSDPTDMNIVQLRLGYDHPGLMAYVDLSWLSFLVGPPLSLSFSDKTEFVPLAGIDDAVFRATRLGFSLSFKQGLGARGLALRVVPGFAALWAAMDPRDGSSAYTWTYGEGRYAASLALGFGDYERTGVSLLGRGFDLAQKTSFEFPNYSWRCEAMLRAAFEPKAPLRFSLYGAWDQGGMSIDGSSRSLGPAIFAGSAPAEYGAEVPAGLRWMAGAEIEVKVFSVEAQTNISHVYINRVFCLLAWRGTFFDSENGSPLGDLIGEHVSFVNSVVLKAGAVLSLTPIASPLRFSPYFRAVLKVSTLWDDEAKNDYDLGLGLRIEW